MRKIIKGIEPILQYKNQEEIQRAADFIAGKNIACNTFKIDVINRLIYDIYTVNIHRNMTIDKMKKYIQLRLSYININEPTFVLDDGQKYNYSLIEQQCYNDILKMYKD